MTRRSNFNDLTGRQFGRLTVVAVGEKQGIGRRWEVICSCGNTKTVRASNLLNGNTRSCGCLCSEVMSKIHRKHGMYGTLTYRCWEGMLKRCRNPNYPAYADYGGRGITVCKQWFSFEGFLMDMGECPEGLSIERRDNEKGYSPDNCHWATRIEQANNRRSSRLVTYRGTTQTVTMWAREVGLNPGTLFYRLDQGWPVERALTARRGNDD